MRTAGFARRLRQSGVLGSKRQASAGAELAGAWRLMGRQQLMAATADQIAAPHAPQRLAQQRPVVGVVVTQKGLVQPPRAQPLRNPDFRAGARDAFEWVLAAVVHRGGAGHWRGQKRLHLVGAKAIALEPERQLQHVLIAGARMGGYEIRNQVLL